MSIAVQFRTKTLTTLVAAFLALSASAQSVNLTFNAPLPGTLTDATGQGTGFTTRLLGTGSSLPVNDPSLLITGGTLAMTSSQTQIGQSAYAYGLNIASVPSVYWSALSGHDATANVRFQPLPPLNANVATGIIFATSTTEYVMYTLTEQGYIGMSSTGAPAQSWATLSSPGVFNVNDSVEISLARSGNHWFGTWTNLSTNTSGNTGPQLAGYLTGAHDLYVGVFAFSPNFGSIPFTVNLDNFVFSAPGSPPPASTPGGSAGPNTVVWPVSSGGNGHAYEVVGTLCSGITWANAHAAAIAAGGYLATITTAAENAYVLGLLGPSAWLGGTQSAFGAEPAGGWRWVTGGEPFTWTNWAPGQPDNGGGSEDRLQIASAAAGGQWNDAADTATAFAYVVEYDPSLPCAPNGTAFTLCAAHDAAGAARLQLFNLPTGTTNGLTLMSAAPATPVGTGAFFGLNADMLTLSIIFRVALPGDPFAWVVLEPGQFPDAPYIFPPGTALPLAGLTWDIMAGAVTNLGTIQFSNIVQVAW